MAFVTVEQLYKALRAHGCSEIQAAGIVGNSVSEVGPSTSNLSPDSELRTDYFESGCCGLWCWEPVYFHPPHPTGNPVTDMNNQISYLKETGGFEHATGSSARAAGENFALTYERCAQCMVGAEQYIARGNQAQAVFDLAIRHGWDKDPAPAKSMHYNWFVKREHTAVVRYDFWRERSHRGKLTRQHTAWLRMRQLQCKALAGVVWTIAHAHRYKGKPSWSLYHRGWRFQQLQHRGQGKRILPS